MNATTTGLIDGLTSCPSGTFNLKTAEPNVSSPARAHKFQWYYDAAATQPITDPTKVKPGTYYMKTISTCSGCESTTTTSFTVNQACPTITGKVFADYDGPSVNGISNPESVGASGGGLFAHLVNSSGVVINSIRIKNDGSYSLNGITGTGFRVIINKDSIIANGTNTLAVSTLNPNYVNTGDVIGGTTGSTTNDGISATFNLTGSQTLANVNFGIQSPPITSGGNSNYCHVGAGIPFTIPQLWAIDDAPDFNNGVGQQLNIKSVTTTNGSLTYGGAALTIAITGAYTISNYNITYLKFTPTSNAASSVVFTYTFRDKAGYESLEPVEVRINFKALVDSPTADSTQYFCSTSNHYLSELVVLGDNIKWHDAATGGNQITSPSTTLIVNNTTYYASQTIIDTSFGTTCESPERTPVLVRLITQPIITIQPQGQEVCLNSTPITNLNVSAVGVGALSYQWYKNTTNSISGATAISGATSNSYSPSYSTADTTYYYAVVSSSCGTTTSTIVPVIVRPTATATISGTTSVCQNSTSPEVTFTNPQSIPITITYTLNSGADQTINVPANSTSKITAPTTILGNHTYALKSVQYSTTPNCPNPHSDSIVVTIRALPTFTVSKNNVTCFNTNTGSIVVTAQSGSGQYIYYLEKETSSGSGLYSPFQNSGTAKSTPHTFENLGAGNYKVRVVDSTGCE